MKDPGKNLKLGKHRKRVPAGRLLKLALELLRLLPSVTLVAVRGTRSLIDAQAADRRE
jgi:hypothetical protein